MYFMSAESLSMESILEVFAKHVCVGETLNIVLRALGLSFMGCYIWDTYFLVIYMVWRNEDLVPSVCVLDQRAEVCQSSIRFYERGLAYPPSLCLFKGQLPLYLVTAFFASATHVQ